MSRICRRDFLNAALLGSGSTLLSGLSPAQLLAQQQESWGGYSGEGDYAHANGNPKEVMLAGHAMRDGRFHSKLDAAVDTGEVLDLVVVGGGLSGLAAALFFQDRIASKRTCLVLESHAIFGGEARRNEFNVNGVRLLAPQGSNFFWVPPSKNLMEDFYQRVGVDWRKFEFQKWAGSGPEMPLSRSSYTFGRQMPPPPNFGFYFGAQFGQRPGMWVVDPWNHMDSSPLPAPMRAQFQKYLPKVLETRREPRADEAEQRRLDSMTAEDAVMEKCGVSREFVRLFLAPHTAAAAGLGPDALSAINYRGFMGNGGQEGWMSFPGGNTGFARHIVKTLIPDAIAGPRTLEAVSRNPVNFEALDRPTGPVRIRLDSMVLAVEHEGEAGKSKLVRVSYLKNGQVYRVRARAVVMAGGGHVTKHLVRDLPSSHRDAYNQFHYSATLVANVAVRNWRFLHKLGLSGGRWFEGFGYWTEVRSTATFGSHSKTVGPDSPTALSLIVPLFYPGLPTAEQGSKGRAELASTSFLEYETRIREQFADMFSGSGFDARRDVAGIILNRWGHAFVNAQPGFFWGKDGKPAPGEFLRQHPFGRIAFAHTDLTGRMDHDHAIYEADRAVAQLAGTVL